VVAWVPDGGAQGGSVPEEGGPCAGDGGYVEGHLDGFVVDDLVGALGEAVPAFWVGLQWRGLGYDSFPVAVVGCACALVCFYVMEGYVEAAGLELCV